MSGHMGKTFKAIKNASLGINLKSNQILTEIKVPQCRFSHNK